MKYFSVPADFKIETLDKYCYLNSIYHDSKIIETYGQLTECSILNSGRITDVLPSVDFASFKSYIRYSKKAGIDFSYTLNPSCFGNYEFSSEGIKNIKEFLYKIYDVGVDSITVTTPSLLEIIASTGLKFNTKTSAICEITSPGKSLFYKRMGVSRLVIDPDITRNFRAIKNICKVFGDGVEVIVNNLCYKNCAYKMFHYNHEAHCTSDTKQDVKDYFFNRCAMQKAQNLSNYVKLNWIRPEDLKFYYDCGIRYFKVQGRQNILKGDIIKFLHHYMREEFDGDIMDLLTLFNPYNGFQPYIDNKKLDGFVERFYLKHDFCEDDCDSCGYCNMFATKSTNIENASILNENALKFYSEYDQYSSLLKKQDNKFQNIIPKLFEDEDLTIDFD